MAADFLGLPFSRRQFVQSAGVAGLGLLAGCGRLPGLVPAPATIPRVGLLLSGPRGPSSITDAFLDGLHDHGYRPDQNIHIESRYSEAREDQLPALAAELVALPIAVLVTFGPPATEAARSATQEIPIVMVAGQPSAVRTGLVANLARPGGNFTGLTVVPPQLLDQKHLELLKEVVPGLSRVGVLWDVHLGPFPQAPFEKTGQSLGLQLLPLEVWGPEGLESALGAATRDHAGGLWYIESPMLYVYRGRIAALALERGLPTISLFRESAEAGALLTYGAHLPTMARRAAAYVDKLLKGTKPAGLPVEQPMLFDFVINLKTAQTLGLTIPQHVLLQATEIIQ